jgi:uncharacterized membrane protein
MLKKLTAYAFALVCAVPILAHAQVGTYKARVVDVISTNERQLEGFEVTVTEQRITVQFLDGPMAGSERTFMQDKFVVEEGETVFVQQVEDDLYQLLEKDRVPMILALLALFVALIFILNGRQGLKSVAGLALSFVVIVFVMLPLVIKGVNPLAVSVLVGGVVLAAVLFLSHGYNRGSVIALGGTLGAIVCAGLLSLGVSYWMRLTGLGDDESLNAMIATAGSVNFANLLLAGIIVGMLGVLEDIAITQVAVVGEIKRANPSLSIHEVFVRALRVGKEHVSALVNTLVLAYTGASFPLLILLYNSGVRFDMLVSQEIVSAEIVRTIVGSIGLIVAVPLTTWLAARYLSKDHHVHDGHGHSCGHHGHAH